MALPEPSQSFLLSLFWLGLFQWPCYPSRITLPVAKPTLAGQRTCISVLEKLHLSIREIWGMGGQETQKLKPNNFCTWSEFQKDKESRKEMGTAKDYVQCQSKLDHWSTTTVPVPSAICGWYTTTLILSQAETISGHQDFSSNANIQLVAVYLRGWRNLTPRSKSSPATLSQWSLQS